MLVTDLRHYLDVAFDAHARLVRLAHQQFDIVRAATARGAIQPWETAIGCTRRPGRTPCPGVLTVVIRGEVIHWRCASCADEGVISGWEESPFDLRGAHPRPTGRPVAVQLPLRAFAAMRRTVVLDTNTEALVCGAGRLDGQAQGVATLVGSAGDLDQLVDELSAEANHEPNRTRRKVLDDAIDACEAALAGRA